MCEALRSGPHPELGGPRLAVDQEVQGVAIHTAAMACEVIQPRITARTTKRKTSWKSPKSMSIGKLAYPKREMAADRPANPAKTSKKTTRRRREAASTASLKAS